MGSTSSGKHEMGIWNIFVTIQQAWLRAVPCLAGSYPFHKLRAMLCRVMDILERVAPCHVICAPCYFCSVSCRVILFVFLSVSSRAVSMLLQIRAVPCLTRRGRPCRHLLGPCLESVLGSSVSSRVMRVSVCLPLPCLALISCRFLGPCRVV